ncbi:MAG: 4-hydroxy-tetrahydrodipicolinate synthase [Myxococcota bacterium]
MTIPFVPEGVWTALATPFTKDNSLDLEAFTRLAQFQIQQGAQGLVPCGTTGESPTLSAGERRTLIESAVHLAGGRLGVLAGTGSNNTAEAIRGAREAKELGADAVLLVDCYYNGPSSLELRTEYYERVLAAVPNIPLVPYVIPGRTGCMLSIADLIHLHQSHAERVFAVKEATGDVNRMQLERELAPELQILSGDDELTHSLVDDPNIKASGTISVMSNIVPAAIHRVVEALRTGDRDEAARMHAAIQPLLERVGCTLSSERILPNGRRLRVEDKFRNPVPVKTMMAGLGMIPAHIRAPLGWMTHPAVQLCREALQTVFRQSAFVLEPIATHFGVDIEARLRDDALWSSLARAV